MANPVKTFVFIFFGLIGAVLLALLSAVGGLFGAGSTLILAALIPHFFIASLFGGLIAGAAFHGLCQAGNKFFLTIAKNEAKPDGKIKIPPTLTAGNKHLWGSLSYAVTTVIGVNLAQAIFPANWSVFATILLSGFLGIIGIIAIIAIGLWRPDLKSKSEKIDAQ